MKKIDLNSDLGEGFGAYRIADDMSLMVFVSSVNIACGYHAGDPLIMDQTVRAALDRQVALGAHIGYPDIQGFGRRSMAFTLRELEMMTLYQLGALSAIAENAGGRLQHANFHGALGNISFTDRDIATTLIGAMKSFDPALRFIGLPYTEASKAAEKAGLDVVYSFLADRAYQKNGTIVPRSYPAAVIKDPDAIVKRIQQLLDDGCVETVDGDVINLPADSILIHSDTANSLSLAKTIKETISSCGAVVSPYCTH